LQVVPISLMKILDMCPDGSTTMPRAVEHAVPDAIDHRVTHLVVATWPHQTNTSVESTTDLLSPCSGSSSVAVRT
jgi:hypothetical protein